MIAFLFQLGIIFYIGYKLKKGTTKYLTISFLAAFSYAPAVNALKFDTWINQFYGNLSYTIEILSFGIGFTVLYFAAVSRLDSKYFISLILSLASLVLIVFCFIYAPTIQNLDVSDSSYVYNQPHAYWPLMLLALHIILIISKAISNYSYLLKREFDTLMISRYINLIFSFSLLAFSAVLVCARSTILFVSGPDSIKSLAFVDHVLSITGILLFMGLVAFLFSENFYSFTGKFLKTWVVNRRLEKLKSISNSLMQYGTPYIEFEEIDDPEYQIYQLVIHILDVLSDLEPSSLEQIQLLNKLQPISNMPFDDQVAYLTSVQLTPAS